MRFSNTLKVSPSDCVASNPQMKEETRGKKEEKKERERESLTIFSYCRTCRDFDPQSGFGCQRVNIGRIGKSGDFV